jgi:hypothetical protein
MPLPASVVTLLRDCAAGPIAAERIALAKE